MNKFRIEQILGITAAALVVIGCIMVLRPFVSALLWASILCFSTWPLFLKLTRVLQGRKSAAAGLMVLLSTLILVAPFAVVGVNLADNLGIAVDWFHSFKQDGLPHPPGWLLQLPVVGEMADKYWTDLTQNTEKTMDLFKELFLKSQGWLLRNSLNFLEGILQLSLSVLIAFFFYRDGEAVVEKMVVGVKKIAGDDTQHLLSVVGGTIKSVVYGILGTALCQGIVAAIGFKIAGIPSALLLGFATFFLSLIPGGPPFIWVPVTLWLFFNGHPALGVFMLVWGFFVISGVDNLIRPYIISRGTKLSFILIFLGVLGGIIAFGFIGLFIGPTLLAIGQTLVQQFIARKAEADQTASAAS